MSLRFRLELLDPLPFRAGFVEGIQRIAAGDHAVSGGGGAFAESAADEFSGERLSTQNIGGKVRIGQDHSA